MTPQGLNILLHCAKYQVFEPLLVQGAQLITTKDEIEYCTVHKYDYCTVQYNMGGNDPPRSKYTIALCQLSSFEPLGIQGAPIIASKDEIEYCTVYKYDYCTVHYPISKSDVLDFNPSSTSHVTKCIF